ncbi:hypothetical protein [Thermococcus sp.]
MLPLFTETIKAYEPPAIGAKISGYYYQVGKNIGEVSSQSKYPPD